VFERFTEAGRAVIDRAQDEARLLRHDHVGTEHLLLAMIGQPDLTGDALGAVGVSAASARRAVLRLSGPDRRTPDGQIPLTRNARSVLTDAEREATVFGQPRVRPEHILIALTRVGQGVAVRLLRDLIGDAGQLREELIRRIDRPGTAPRLDVVDRVTRLERELARLSEEVAALRRGSTD
jgi:ATP-dependent Clp protease ATP-binding subunit ClpC